MIQKHRFIYKAVAEAVEGFGNRHHLQARAHFAPLLGYRGPNGHIQVSSMLNCTTYNPANPKRMSVDQLAVLLYELDEEGREDVLSAILDEYGYNLCKAPDAPQTEADTIHVLQMTLGIDSVHGDLAKTLFEALEDGTIDEDESEAIRKATFNLRKAIRELEEMLK
ncbi:phage regulatory CII family protein [Hydrogenimonas urashimensis]|uniref:phage regulatory CII family protein n=1 Tax=Hydrogenimonas urashimensis TaxID=2740515 RepID=UPI0019162795|nr:phage regulatory CII family protein [Hydrogenimonas urashimensis]